MAWARRAPVEAWFDDVDGGDLDHSLAVAAAIIAAGQWRSWMLRRFVRLHRHELGPLMSRLGPLLPPPCGDRG